MLAEDPDVDAEGEAEFDVEFKPLISPQMPMLCGPPMTTSNPRPAMSTYSYVEESPEEPPSKRMALPAYPDSFNLPPAFNTRRMSGISLPSPSSYIRRSSRLASLGGRSPSPALFDPALHPSSRRSSLASLLS